MDTIWEAYTESVDWEGYIQQQTQISLHRTKEGAEGAVEDFNKTYPSLASNVRYSIGIRPRMLKD